MNHRVVLDTNVLVSGLLGGTATDIIRRWRAGDFRMVLSPDIMAEYEGVLNRPKFRLPKWVVQDLLAYTRASAEWVTPVVEESGVARDPSDDKFLFTAASGRADWLVSADPDLLDLKEFRSIPIVPTWEFLSLLDS
jgi:putative PIN family toxin of toxin-antitoxin system